MKKKLTTLVLLLAFAAVAVTGGTLAYFTDKTDAAVNIFTMGNVKIELSEPNWVASNATNVYPGKTLVKDPTVTIVGSNDTFVRLKLTVASKVLDVYKTQAIDTYEKIFPVLVKDLQSDWSLTKVESKNDNVIYTVTCAKKLETGNSVKAFKQIYISEQFTNEDVEALTDAKFNITVVAEAIQADGFTDATAAFTAFDNQA